MVECRIGDELNGVRGNDIRRRESERHISAAFRRNTGDDEIIRIGLSYLAKERRRIGEFSCCSRFAVCAEAAHAFNTPHYLAAFSQFVGVCPDEPQAVSFLIINELVRAKIQSYPLLRQRFFFKQLVSFFGGQDKASAVSRHASEAHRRNIAQRRAAAVNKYICRVKQISVYILNYRCSVV